MKKIGGRFGAGVFEPLYEHMCKGRHCAHLICQLVDAYVAADRERMQELCNAISETESQADQIKFAIRSGLTKSIFATVKRNDVLQIVRNQDKICGRAEDVAKLMVVRTTILPGGCEDVLKRLAGKVDQAVETLLACCQLLAMIPTYEAQGTDTHEADQRVILTQLDLVHDREAESDVLVHEFIKELLAREKESDPLSVMLLLEMVRLISGMADEAENAAEGYTSLLHH